jgi:imidazole glycerol-phosphate synthase subunit HisH
MKVGIVDIGLGNLASVANALRKLEIEPFLCDSPDMLMQADSIILPGVGAFPAAMALLIDREFDSGIRDYVSTGRILVGICLGMQLLLTESTEIRPTLGLNLIPGRVEALTNITNLVVPHMGWNNVTTNNPHYKKFEGNYYFVHSYYCMPSDRKSVLFECNYGNSFAAALSSGDGVFGLQFHPEKSQRLGLNLLKECLQAC